jgi:sulfur carrier protein ThiS
MSTSSDASSIADLATKAQTPPTWLWQVFGAVLLMLGVWWLKYQLSKTSAELAEAKTALALNNLKAQQALVAASVEADTVKRKEAEAAANEARAKVAAEEKALAAVAAEHALNVKKIAAVADKDWDALNKLAGVITLP